MDPKTRAQLAALKDADRAALAESLRARTRAVSWRHKARPKQRPPWNPAAGWTGRTYAGEDGLMEAYSTWLLMGGRGSGKTWAGANAAAEIAIWVGATWKPSKPGEVPPSGAIVAPTYRAAATVCVEGESGIIAALGGYVEFGGLVRSWNYGKGELTLTNGFKIYVDSAHGGAERVQGRNLAFVWADEVGLWSLGDNGWRKAWEESIDHALRKEPALAILTGTPKSGHEFVRYLIDDPTVYVTEPMSTMDNAALSEKKRRALLARYEGTRIGEQEIYGRFLDQVDGALWTSALIDTNRAHPDDFANLRRGRFVIGWDPAVTATGDEHGIVVVGEGAEDPQHIYVPEDLSGHYTPDEACRVVAAAADRWGAFGAVVEVNNGGDWIPALAKQVRPDLHVEVVRATRGKTRRAEPIVAVTEQGRFHLVGEKGLARLTDQMTTFTDAVSWSPDRMDAMVWGATYLLERQDDGEWSSAVA